MRTRVVLAWLLAALVCAGVVAVSVIPPVPGAITNRLVGAALLAACWAVTGALLITARPGNAVGWLVLLCGVLQGWSSLGNAYGGYGVGVADPMWPAANWVALSASMIYLPSGLTVVTVQASLSQGAYDDIAPGPPPVVLPDGAWMSVLFGACTALILGGTLAIWVMTGLRLARATSPLRGQLAWYVATVLPGFLLILMAALPQWLTLLGGLSIPLAIAVGVLRYRMLDIVLPPVLVYGCLTVVVGAVFVGVSALAGSAVDRGPLPGVIAAGLVAVGLTPARDRVQRGADRFVYGERRDPMRAVVTLGDRVGSAEPESLLGVVLTSVADSVRAPGASVTGAAGQTLAVFGEVSDTAVTFPLVVAGDPVGTLRVAPRVAGSTYSAADGRVLRALGPQVAVVVHALDLAGALEAQRDRVVAATRSERDRLRREMHDGLGPTLAGTALGLQAARDALAADDPETLGRLLDRIGAEVDLAVADVRRVIDDLRPADLDDGSLNLAVRRRAASVASVIDVDVQVGAPPDLRPEVETAAYRITSEALSNVARHAGAHHVQVAVAVADGSLTLRVADDGAGIPDGAASGVGLDSMRRRAQSVGGTFDIESGQDGTVISARLPL